MGEVWVARPNTVMGTTHQPGFAEGLIESYWRARPHGDAAGVRKRSFRKGSQARRRWPPKFGCELMVRLRSAARARQCWSRRGHYDRVLEDRMLPPPRARDGKKAVLASRQGSKASLPQFGWRYAASGIASAYCVRSASGALRRTSRGQHDSACWRRRRACETEKIGNKLMSGGRVVRRPVSRVSTAMLEAAISRYRARNQARWIETDGG